MAFHHQIFLHNNQPIFLVLVKVNEELQKHSKERNYHLYFSRQNSKPHSASKLGHSHFDNNLHNYQHLVGQDPLLKLVFYLRYNYLNILFLDFSKDELDNKYELVFDNCIHKKNQIPFY